MPLLYGERDRAFIRLQEEIMKGSNDHSIFAWTSSEDHGGPLATSPAAFANSRDIVPVDPSDTIGNHPAISNQGVQLTSPFMGVGEEAVGLTMLNCTKSNRKDLFVAIYLRDVSLIMKHFERAQCGELELVNPKKFNSLIYPARQLYIRSERPKKRVMSERPELCVIDLERAETNNVHFQPIWELSNGTLATAILPIDTVFGRILMLSTDGVLYQIVLSRIKGSLSAEIVTDSKSCEEPSPGQTTDPQLKNKTSQISKEVASKTHVSVGIQTAE